MTELKTQPVYHDRYGAALTPSENDVCADREGVFALCLSRGKVLVMYPEHSPEVPELPGGGIENGENIGQALVREIHEETNVNLPISCVKSKPDFTQRVFFYAANKDEYWDYTQSFIRLEGAELDSAYFEGTQKSEEDGIAQWVAIEELEEMKLHFMHKKALKKLL